MTTTETARALRLYLRKAGLRVTEHKSHVASCQFIYVPQIAHIRVSPLVIQVSLLTTDNRVRGWFEESTEAVERVVARLLGDRAA